MAKKDWKKKFKKDESDLKEIAVYTKPLEKVVLCKVNKKDEGTFSI